MIIFLISILSASLLFYLVNLIGEHAVDFGYRSTTLFEEPTESLALNFFIRALAPAVFIIAFSATVVAIGRPDLRLGTYWIALIYYIIRLAYIFIFNLQRLVSWRSYTFHATIGIGAAILAYYHLVLPNKSLLPNVEQAGNELWLAILAFIYAVANKVKFSGDPGDGRRNRFISDRFEHSKRRFGRTINKLVSSDTLKLISYSILVYEDYCRPSAFRAAERLLFWKKIRTTGVMQVSSVNVLSDEESVVLGVRKLANAWAASVCEEWPHVRVRATILDYNFDENYASRVFDVMEIIAKRSAPQFRSTYEAIMNYQPGRDLPIE